MKFENIKSDGMKREYSVLLTADDIENGIVTEVSKKAKTFKMHGFRMGHVPLNIVRNSIEDSIINNVLDSLISTACNKITKDSKATSLALRPVYRFESQYEKGRDVNLTVTIELAPTFDLKPYEIEITKIVPNVSDEDVLAEATRIMDACPVRIKAEGGYAIKPKDAVTYKAIYSNKNIGNKEKSFTNKVIIPGEVPEDAEFLKSFIGKKIGDVFDFSLEAEKDVTHKIHIKSIEKALSDLSPEDYVQKQGFKNLDEFNLAIKETLENEINATAFLYHKNQILEALVKQYNFELPQSIVDNEMKNVIADVKRELEEEQKKNPEKKIEQQSDEDLKKEYVDVANNRVLLGYVLNKIAQTEKITVTNNEINNAIQTEIDRNPELRSQLIEYYSKNEGAIAYKKAEIVEYKVVSFLIAKAKANEIKKTKKETEEMINELLKD